MSHYKSNIRDIEFNLFEVLARDEVLGQAPFEEVDADTARSILHEVDRLAREELAASFEDADRNPPVYDPKTCSVTMPESFKKSYHAWMDAEWFRLVLDADLGGQPVPSTLAWSVGRDGARLQPRGVDVRLRTRVRQHRVPQRQRAGQEDRPAHGRPPLGRHHGAHRAGRRLRRRRRPHQGHAAPRTAAGTSRAPSGSSPPASTTWPRTSCTWCWRGPSASRARAAPAPRASRCSSSRSSTSTWRPVS